MQVCLSQTTECYEFDTEKILGTINPFGHYYGVSGLMHCSYPVSLVRVEKSFLNAEYYIHQGSRKMLPRAISAERRTTHELLDESVIVRFPPESEYALALSLTYSIYGNAIDMAMTINPTIDVPGFELFFASYVCEALEETWVPLRGKDGTRAWTKICNRGRLNSIFGFMRDASLLELLENEYPDLAVDVQDAPFSESILIARDSKSGLALIFLCDPHTARYLAGQYHGWDTAHDWAFGADLKAGQEISAHSRLICRLFPSAEQMCESVIELWN